MTQEVLTQLVNEAKMLAEQDPTNDFETILDELIRDYEQ